MKLVDPEFIESLRGRTSLSQINGILEQLIDYVANYYDDAAYCALKGSCRYRARTTSCMVGYFITEDMYKTSMEGNVSYSELHVTDGTLEVDKALEIIGFTHFARLFLTSCQRIHDKIIAFLNKVAGYCFANAS